METKICSKCDNEKTIDEFYVNPINKKHRSFCKICFNLKAKEYRDKNIDKIKKYSKHYKSINKDKIKESSKIYREKNKDLIKERQKINSRKYYLKNSEVIKLKSKNFREKNPEYFQKYLEGNPNYGNTYQKNRRKSDPLFRVIHTVRTRINGYLNSISISKKNKTFDIVGCTPEFLKEHLEKQFKQGMTWEKMGKEIHIDHIIPLSSAKTEEEIYKLCHYTNLQPLWVQENLIKGNKII